jgi:hypothetical protein
LREKERARESEKEREVDREGGGKHSACHVNAVL